MKKISRKWYSIIILFAALCAYIITDEVNKLSDYYEILAQVSTADIASNRINLKEIIPDVAIQKDSFGVMVFGGDVMLGRGVESSVKKNTVPESVYKWVFPWKYIRTELVSADVAFVNLEGPISDIGKDGGKKYSFRFLPDVLQGMEYSGIDVMSMANNHALDWGRDALCDSVRRVESVEIDVIGAGCTAKESWEPYVAVVGDTSVAVFAITEFDTWGHATDERPGLTPNDMAMLMSKINEQRQDGVDIIIVSTHWGEEYKHIAPKRIQDEARIFADMGVDLVVGHHPHVPQQIEKIYNTWVAYSLGNFIFDQSWSEDTMQGMLLRVTLGGGQILDIEGLEIVLNEKYQPRLTGVKIEGVGSLTPPSE
jgi:poly-gamma-glutamate capsule biosynthesis protein CapA/YwtB (metallophosphatase superfamily)